ncbi:MAG: asparaginyl-tRNA synthetase, asparaginyl-tRNA synthetase [Candidatus Peregrinibacteria bacterium GW2011_GWC2_39_14]|nr:MAG: Asparagine-tRNA ligase [Candidatus Peregrinibacteria bacterium GW2011_GWA2_38_36]KKR04969.1 MAG: asparaginyl-tRNA synthetase, asparaginyl-tRNA synthetase [Candidatus Peregrinibacteria bacterium GW2011_GWC2_39_14]
MNIFINQAADFVGQEITIRGWMFNKRSSGKIHFLELRDGTGEIQGIVFVNAVSPEVFEKAGKLTIESSAAFTGTISKHPKLENTFELQVKDIEIYCIAPDDYPIGKKEHGPDFLLENRHLWLRSKKQWANMRIRDEIIWAIREYMRKNEFTLVDAPILTKTACEGTTDLFHVDYFESDAYLSQSGQLYTEAAEYALGKTYCFGPTFRAEKSKTRRHLTEFWMIEPEVPFMKFDELMDFEEDFLWYVLQSVLKNRRKELEVTERDISFLENIKRPFPRITYHEAIKILQESGKSDIKDGDDFGADDETYIAEHFKAPVFIHRFPTSLTSFFQEPDPNNPNVTLNVDLIAPEGYGELIGGGSQRSYNLELLEKRIAEEKMERKDYAWYLDTMKYGGMPHCGFGMGLERCVAWLTGSQHVRETIPFPRTINRICP